jgi:hypothetical protein
MFLVEYGVDVIGKGKNGKGEKRWRIPKFVEETPEIYDEHESERFFVAAAIPSRRLHTARC